MSIFTGAKTIAKVPSTQSTILGKTKKKLNFTFLFITYTIFALSRYSMESHVVHWNRKYVTVEECFRHKDGFCILAYLFLVQPDCCNCINPQLERITEHLKYIPDPDMETKIPPNCLAWMRWSTYCTRYYTYAGSYNIGEYSECVTWIVFPVVIPIRASEIKEFRRLRDRDGNDIKTNWREIQLLKCRQIFLAIS
ncbi:carbonic anhydrase 13-like isoform X1 [Bombus pascuorum]|uniref:carbonic anhydrase 13-like isoform X1 n=1 Tax=Bombus pascuorum TaxID=65598 RepID=UPI00298DDA9C|nr:carbonic anhydrase 13-like isoform X1 [Bombus pascuorum]